MQTYPNAMTVRMQGLKAPLPFHRISAPRWQSNVSKSFNGFVQEKRPRLRRFLISKNKSLENRVTTTNLYRCSDPIVTCWTTSRDIVVKLEKGPRQLMIQNSHQGERELPVTKNNKKMLIECLSDPDPHAMMMTPILQKEKSMSTSSLGSHEMSSTPMLYHRLSDKPNLLSRISLETSSSPNRHLSTPSIVHNSQIRNGPASSLGVRSTSTMSCRGYSPYPRNRNTKKRSDNSKLLSVCQLRLNQSRHMESGSLHGIPQSKPQPMPSPIRNLNSRGMGSTSSSSSQLSHQNITTESSVSTEQSESELRSDVTCCLLILENLSTSTCIGSKVQEVVHPPDSHRVLAVNLELDAPKNMKHAVDGTKIDVPIQPPHVVTPMSVQSVVVTPTLPQSAKSDSFQHDLTRPRYLRDFIWFEEEPSSVPSALATEFMLPVPTPPINELSNSVALHTIRNHPHLFKIITPINVDSFRSYLLDHPNRSFVDSVCQGLCDGFWPWAITDDPSLPVTWDNSHCILKEQGHVDFVREQRDVEIQLGQFSPSFGPDLLPGMYSIPIGVIPKPHSNKLRMVVDQSAEPFSLNSM